MAAVDPGAYGPGPHEINNNLINAVHHAITAHPSAAAKATYGKILASLLAHQQAAHAAEQTSTQHGLQGGPQAEPDTNPALTLGNVGQVAAGTPPLTQSGQYGLVNEGAVPNPMLAALLAAIQHPAAGGPGAALAGYVHPILAQHVPLAGWNS